MTRSTHQTHVEVVPMPQLSEARDREDNWTGTTDAAARRRAQTRLNMRAYRRRNALAKQAEASGNPGASSLVKSEPQLECWDVRKEAVSVVAASRIKTLYDAEKPLLPLEPGKRQSSIIFPLCPDNLMTLVQFNAVRAMAVNRSLMSGILATPLDCSNEVIHVIPKPANPGSLPPALLPTILQQTVPHGDWIDIFPSPEGRDRLILAAGTFDEDELWADCVGGLYEGFSKDGNGEIGGIIAWSPPWDIRGWEMSERFLRKWGWLLGELPGAKEATNRWRMQRGEQILD